jgi:polyphosphate glucokinase
MAKERSTITLCLDIGGTGIKGMTVDERGKPTAERVRIETPQPATPEAVLAVVRDIVRQMPPFQRVAAGFPGVVVEGTVHTAPNLGDGWAGCRLAESLETLTGRPARVANDAGVQGLAVIEGKGTELVITFGTGMGFALYVDGRYVPNIEMAHHVFRKDKTYEERVGNRALEKVGKRRWNKRVRDVIDHLAPVFNYRRLYLGGGNSRHLKLDLPPTVTIVENLSGLLGGVRLWQPYGEGEPAAAPASTPPPPLPAAAAPPPTPAPRR